MARTKKDIENPETDAAQVPNTFLEQAIAMLNKKFSNGNGPVAKFGSDLAPMTFAYTGTDLVDAMILGGKGFPRGLIAICTGDEGSGKSSFLLTWISSIQKQFPEKIVVVILTERGDYTPEALAEFDINPDQLIVLSAPNAEANFDMLQSLLWDSEKNKPLNIVSLWAIDSVPGLTPAAEMKLSYEDPKRMAATATLLHPVLRGFSSTQGDAIGVLINQQRDTFATGGAKAASHGYGGRAPGYWPRMRLHFKKFDYVKSDGKYFEQQVESFQISVIAEKNSTHVGVPGAQVYYKVYNQATKDHARGVSSVESLIRAAVMLGIVKKSGGWHSLDKFSEHSLPIKENGEAKFGKAIIDNGYLNRFRELVMEAAWKEASAGRTAVSKFVLDASTGEMVAPVELGLDESEVEGTTSYIDEGFEELF